MLLQTENQRLTQLCGEAPAGQMLRRYWMPACLADEIAEPDCTPLRVRLLGEQLVAFRDSAGSVGLIDNYCPHRRAALSLGRNEEGGIRCIYHGWKFDVSGACMEMPTEPDQFGFRDRLNIKSYPVREAGGLIWTYLGPQGTEPPFPTYDWMRLPREQLAILKVGERVNLMQTIEGAIDSAHSWFLHRGVIPGWQARAALSNDTAPKLQVDDTDYGLRYAAIRKTNANEHERYIRVTSYVMPYTVFIPRSMDKTELGHTIIFVPVDDHHSYLYDIFYSQDGHALDEAAMRKEMRAERGPDLDRRFFRHASEENDWNQDREAMKNDSYTGIYGFENQDIAIQESMGSITDRSLERLGTSDVAIIRMRKRMLDNIDRWERGEPLIGLQQPIDYEAVRGWQRVLDQGIAWNTAEGEGEAGALMQSSSVR